MTQLWGFNSVELEAGESHTVTTLLRRADLEYWSIDAGRWVLEPAGYTIHVRASSRDLHEDATIILAGDWVRETFTLSSTIGELLADPAGAAVVDRMVAGMMKAATGEDSPPRSTSAETLQVMSSFPLVRMVSFSGAPSPQHNCRSSSTPSTTPNTTPKNRWLAQPPPVMCGLTSESTETRTEKP